MAINDYPISYQKDCLSLQFLRRSGLYPLVAELVEAGEGDTMPWIRDRLPRPSDESSSYQSMYQMICLSIHPSIHLKMNQFIYHPSTCPPTHSSIHYFIQHSSSTHLPTPYTSRIYPTTHSSIHLSIDPSIIYIPPPFTHLAAHPHVNPPTHPFIPLAIHLSVHPSLGPLQHTWAPLDWALC